MKPKKDARLTADDFEQIKLLFVAGVSIEKLSNKFLVTKTMIKRVLNGTVKPYDVTKEKLYPEI